MKKILFLINTLNGGGAEKVLIDLVNNLSSEKYAITVQTIIDEGVYKAKLNSSIRYKTINKIRMPFIRRMWTYLINFIIPPAWIYRVAIADHYDLEIAFLEGVPTKLLSASNNRIGKKFAWVHIDLSKYYGHEKVFKKLEDHKSSYRRFDRILCVSESVKEGFINLFGDTDKLAVVYNPIDEVDIRSRSHLLVPRIVPEGFIFITVGRLTEQKSHSRLLRACKRLRDDEVGSFTLWILGDGEERQQLEDYIKEQHLSEIVKLLGFQTNPYGYMKAADAFVCSSITEGFSTVVTEAVILQLPVVTTDCAGMKEILGDSEFGLITENSEQGIYNGMKQFLIQQEVYRKYKMKVIQRSSQFTLAERMSHIESLFS